MFALEDLTLDNMLRRQARACRDETFLKLREGSLTFGEVDETAGRLAHGLAERGVAPRDHVALMMPNSADFLHALFALARLGAVAVPINTQFKGDLLRHVLTTSDASMLIIDERFVDRLAKVEMELTNLRSVVVHGDGAAERSLHTATLPWADILGNAADAPRAPVQFSDLQAIMYTSGTTGPSKGVMVPHALGLSCALDSLYYMNHQPEDTVYCPMPLYHAGGLWDGMMMALLAGSPIAVVERFSASCFWDDVRAFDAVHAIGIFDVIPILMNQPACSCDRDHPLRRFYMGKSALDEAFYERFGVRAIETYTSTEVGIGTGSPYGEWRTGSCGRANRERYEVSIVDEQCRELGPGEPGELVLRPKQPHVITGGYYNYPQVTAEAFRNLWFHTGDRAYYDEDGYFFFVNRIKDSIRRKGENISAFEVECAVNDHPDVLESAAFGVPSGLVEEEVKVAVVLQTHAEPDPETLMSHCHEELPGFMVPRYVEFVDELPRTGTNKIAKQELKEEGDSGITDRTWDAES